MTIQNQGGVTLDADNTYTGATQVDGEDTVVFVARSHALGADGRNGHLRIESFARLVLNQGVTIDERVEMVSSTLANAGTTATVNGDIVLRDELSALDTASTLTINGKVTLADVPPQVLQKTGPGTVVFTNPASDFSRLDVLGGTVRLGAANTLPRAATIALGVGGAATTLDLNGFATTVQAVTGGVQDRILLGNGMLTIASPADHNDLFSGAISGTGAFVKDGTGTYTLSGTQANTYTGLTTVQAGTLILAKSILESTIVSPLTINGGTVASTTNQLAPTVPVTVNAPGVLNLQGSHPTIASLGGNGQVLLGLGPLTTGSGRSAIFAGTITGTRAGAGLPPDAYFRLIKRGVSTFVLSGTNNLGDQAVIDEGVFQVDGRLTGGGVLLRNGTLSGSGTIAGPTGVVSNVIMQGGQITPGSGRDTIGILHGDAAAFSGGGLFVMQIAGAVAGTGYDQLDLTNNLTLDGTARLIVQRTFAAPQGSRFTAVNLAPGRVVNGIFLDLPEGGTLTASGQRFSITYHGGDGNDVVLTALDPPPATLTYYLSDGATGTLFDEDVLIANPNAAAAPVTLTFTKDTGEQIETSRVVPATSHLTVHVDQIPGLESAGVSAIVTSDSGQPIAVERQMFLGKAHGAGTAATAVSEPMTDWFFAAGVQGAPSRDEADTILTLFNPSAESAAVEAIFLRDNAGPVRAALAAPAFGRTVYPAVARQELQRHTYGMVLHATQPIVAERSTYINGQLSAGNWTGGHASAGATALATQWFFADGATGAFFDTVFQVTNPQPTAAHLTLQFLLDTGDPIVVSKTVLPGVPMRINVDEEADVRLHNAAFFTILTSDVPVVAERTMTWPTTKPAGASHDSFGVTEPGTKWALADGRVGLMNAQTYILIGNAETTAAHVTVTFLREHAAPVVKTYTVPATSRFNIDAATVTELQNEAFGVSIESTNGVPIIVERSTYWDANGVRFSGGTNVTGVRLP